jgi:hypothetical protein
MSFLAFKFRPSRSTGRGKSRFGVKSRRSAGGRSSEQVGVLADIRLGFVPSLSGLASGLSLPGTDVPGYRLFRPHSTSSGQALRDYGTAEAVPFRLHLYRGSSVHLGDDLGHVRASARTFQGRPPRSLLKLPSTEYAIAAAHQRGADGAIGVNEK